MNEKIRQERKLKLQKTIDAAIGHLRDALSTLEDANLYTNDDQEHDIDVLVNRLEDVISDAHVARP